MATYKEFQNEVSQVLFSDFSWWALPWETSLINQWPLKKVIHFDNHDMTQTTIMCPSEYLALYSFARVKRENSICFEIFNFASESLVRNIPIWKQNFTNDSDHFFAKNEI